MSDHSISRFLLRLIGWSSPSWCPGSYVFRWTIIGCRGSHSFVLYYRYTTYSDYCIFSNVHVMPCAGTRVMMEGMGTRFQGVKGLNGVIMGGFGFMTELKAASLIKLLVITTVCPFRPHTKPHRVSRLSSPCLASCGENDEGFGRFGKSNRPQVCPSCRRSKT